MVDFRLASLLLLLIAPDTSAQESNLTCSGTRTSFSSPGQSQRCMSTWGEKNETKVYPDDFDNITNVVDLYICPALNKRIMISNGIPDHTIVTSGTRQPCEVNWVVEIPLRPVEADDRTEVPMRGMIAMAINGVPAFGPQESNFANAVEPGDGKIQGAQFWYGHTSANNVWHVHSPKMGEEFVTEDDLLGYAMDGFPIYGPVNNTDELDPCNGRLNDEGEYQYHVRKKGQVDEDADYCNGASPETNWNYILGCYSGTVVNSAVFDSTEYHLDLDYCFQEDTIPGPTPAPTTKAPSSVDTRPNIIIIQPDDLPFFDEWGAPPNLPERGNTNLNLPKAGMPHIERLRTKGLQMMQAYTTSPACGTSRYSTITGKYPSRSSYNRESANLTEEIAEVTIPTTKLADVNGYHDCAGYNLASTFRSNGYNTSMIGKWHLSAIKDETYTYDNSVHIVEGCGFDTVTGLYIENLKDGSDDDPFGNFGDGTFSHNMEWITWEAINIINYQAESGKPFFMYFNPTVPHGSNGIAHALLNFTCRDTANGDLGFEPNITGMTGDYGGSCVEYRDSIFNRTEYNEDEYGSVWLDDSVGALLKTLEDNNILDNTIIIFQEDHGMDLKGSLYEQGVRIPQFIHYPDEYDPDSTFDAPVSVIDIGATLFDFAGITPNYELDGESWRDAVGNKEQTDYWVHERCLFFEYEWDRGARCGCDKYLFLTQNENLSSTYSKGLTKNFSTDEVNLFDLCDGTDDYVTDKTKNMEESGKNLKDAFVEKSVSFEETVECHLNNTDLWRDPEYTYCELDYVAPPSLSPAPSLPLCREEPGDKFFYRITSGIPRMKDCDWLTRKNNPISICETYVDYHWDENGDKFLPAREVCKETCLTCYLLNPSQVPSSPPSIISISESPSMAPSLMTSDPPSNPPSDPPTDPPTDSPSLFPSLSASNTPSDLPSMVPSNAPSTSSECGDKDGMFYWKTNKRGTKIIKKKCSWLATYDPSSRLVKKICKMSTTKDNLPLAKELCPLTCCTDQGGTFYWKTNKRGTKIIKKKCSWLAKYDPSSGLVKKICEMSTTKDNLPLAKELCPNTCNVCPGC